MKILVIDNNDKEIIVDSVEQWLKYAPPKQGEKHWKDGRSAKELAKAWFRNGKAEIPSEIKILLDSHTATKGFIPQFGIPELVTPLDNFRGEGRNHDFVLIGEVENQRILIAIEAKADEPFGEVVEDYWQRSVPPSRVRERIQILCESVWGQSIDQSIGKLRYQLLTGLAGALIEAKRQKANRAIFIIHEFVSNSVTKEKMQRNHKDFQEFICSFPGLEKLSVRDTDIVGALKCPGGPFVPGDINVYIGKVVTTI